MIIKITVGRESRELNNNRMKNFPYWHSYFDSVFLKSEPILPLAFLHQINIHQVTAKPWPPCLLPQLHALFTFLDNFIQSGLWKQCNCEQKEARIIESKLNNVVILLQVEKVYARQFWKDNKKKIESSFIHFYLILKQMFLSILPEQCDCLINAVAGNKLCLQLGNVEQIVNFLLSKIKPIHLFLCQPQFKEQKNLISQLFKQLITFCQGLPEMSRGDLRQIPKLMRYICLNNPLDNLKVSHPKLRNRKKSSTIEVKQKKNDKSRKQSDCISDLNSNSTYKKSQLNSERVSLSSCGTQVRYDVSKLFVFSIKIHQDSNQVTRTITSNPYTRKDSMLDSVKIQRNRSTTISPQGFAHLRGLKKRTTLQRKISDVSSGLLSPSRKSRTFDSSLQKRCFILQKTQDIEQQRKNIVELKQQKEVSLDHVSFLGAVSTFDPQTGKSRGWQVIRDYILRKKAEKQMQRLLGK